MSASARGATPPPLPIDARLPEILAALGRAGNLVLVAPPGVGKTTRLPPALLAAGLAGERGRVVMLEPRRVAARAAARRIASEQGWDLGGEVGYQVRFERRASARTRLLVVTEGVLVRLLQADPFLDGVAVVVFDELHERSLDADLSLAMTRRLQRQARPDLRLVAMSATLDAGPLAAFLDGEVVQLAERAFPVEVRWLPAGERDSAPGRAAPALAAAAVRQALAATTGGVLAFLPGAGEIERASALLADLDVPVLPLHGSLPDGAQDAALAPEPRRRVVLATNLAETSLTVPGITAVVDSGLARQPRFDPGAGLDRLELVRISRAAATQRAGRAGREGPGLCLRLWSELEHATLAARELPELLRVDLAGPVLELRAWGEPDPAGFPWLEPPPAEALARADALLRELGALGTGGLTADGRAMARLPLHPRLARLVLDAHRGGALAEGALAAALLAERDPFRRGRDGEGDPAGGARGASGGRAAASAVPPTESDLVARLELVAAAARGGGGGRRKPYGEITAGAARRVLQARDQLVAIARRELGDEPASTLPREEALGRALLAAFPDRLARRRAPGDARAVMVGNRGVVLGAESGVRRPELFLALDLDAGRRGERAEARVRIASGVEPAWLPAETLIEREETFHEAERDRVLARRRTLWRDLVVAETEVPVRDAAAAEAALVAAAAADPRRALPLDDEDVATFLCRVRWLRAARPELDLPSLDDAQLVALLPALVAGRRSLAELRRAPLLDVLRGLLTAPQLQALEREAPERLEVPSGSRIRVQYEEGRPPVLAARIQELFGLAETPRLAGGRAPVLLHLLAPNHRPQQVTDDLASFWKRTYPEVRKELRARYPRHAWPEDPTTAPAERRPQRRR